MTEDEARAILKSWWAHEITDEYFDRLSSRIYYSDECLEAILTIRTAKQREARSRAVLGDIIDNEYNAIRGEGITWQPGHSKIEIGDGFIGGEFTADELEAIAWWMRNKKAPPT